MVGNKLMIIRNGGAKLQASAPLQHVCYKLNSKINLVPLLRSIFIAPCRGVFYDIPEFIFAFTQDFFRFLALGDVYETDQYFRNFTVVIKDWKPIHIKPDDVVGGSPINS